jgi:putative drug exporter of the RND superfamily
VPSDAVQQAVEPELEALPTHEAGPAVAAAGVILAGTFAALIGSPLPSQTGFAVALGVLLAAFMMAWVLVPSLTALLGRTGFWPGKTSRIATEPDAAAADRTTTDLVPPVQRPAPAMAESR